MAARIPLQSALAAGLFLSTASGCWEPWEEFDGGDSERTVDTQLVGRWTDGQSLGVEFVEDGAFAIRESDGEPRYGEYNVRGGLLDWSAFDVKTDTYKFGRLNTYSYAVSEEGLALDAYLPSEGGNTWRANWGYGTSSEIREPAKEPVKTTSWTMYESTIELEDDFSFTRTETIVSIEDDAIIDGTETVTTGTYQEDGSRFEFLGDNGTYLFLERFGDTALYAPNESLLRRVN